MSNQLIIHEIIVCSIQHYNFILFTITLTAIALGVAIVGLDVGVAVVGDADVGPDVGLAVVGVVVIGLDMGVALLSKLQIMKFLNEQSINYS